MSPEHRERVVVVLVRARNPANIGASARALHDLGFSRLRIVNNFPVPFHAAKAAVDASSVLEAAEEFTSVAEAVADCTLVYGTTAVGERVLEHPLHLVGEAAGRIGGHLTADNDGRVALLFGSEKTGLSNEELSHCHALLTIPMNAQAGRHLSMNLGQAVAVCLYAISQAGASGELETQAEELPEVAGEVERLTTLLGEVLERSGYTRRHPANAREEPVRRLVRRMMLRRADSVTWMGILRQLAHALPETDRRSATSEKDTSDEESMSSSHPKL